MTKNKKTISDIWNESRREIFRLEILPEYKVPEDLAIFEKWKNGSVDFKKEAIIWFKSLKNTSRKGVEINRIRIVPQSIPEYICYEIDFWRHSMENGENIFLCKEEDFIAIKSELNFEPKDFLLGDDEVLIIFEYKDGDFLKGVYVDDQSVIKNYQSLKQKLFKKSTSLKKFN